MTEVTAGFADVNGTRLAYEVAGDGEPIVLIHGLGLDRRIWDDQVEAFAAAYRVIRYDLRGFGTSAPAGTAPFRHADDLHALLRVLGVARKVHVVGSSMGARIALQYALLAPAAVASLVLADAALDRFAWSDAWNASLAAISQRARSAGAAAGNAMWLEHELFAPAREQPAVRAKLEAIVGASPGRHWIEEGPERGIKPPASARLHEVRVPTLVVVGERDLPDFRRIAEKLVREIPSAHAVTLAGAGHMSTMEKPAEFNRLALDFVRRAGRGDSCSAS